MEQTITVGGIETPIPPITVNKGGELAKIIVKNYATAKPHWDHLQDWMKTGETEAVTLAEYEADASIRAAVAEAGKSKDDFDEDGFLSYQRPPTDFEQVEWALPIIVNDFWDEFQLIVAIFLCNSVLLGDALDQGNQKGYLKTEAQQIAAQMTIPELKSLFYAVRPVIEDIVGQLFPGKDQGSTEETSSETSSNDAVEQTTDSSPTLALV